MTTSTSPYQAVTTNPVAPAPLSEVSDPKTTLQYLRSAVGLTPSELAQAVGADERTIRRWMNPGDASKIQQRHDQRIDDLRSLVTLLADTLPGEQTGRWLRARNRHLKRQRPLELLSLSKEAGYDAAYHSVESAAEAYLDGDPT